MCQGCNRREKLQRAYGITPEEFLVQLEIQDGKCACCGKQMLLTYEDGRHPDKAVVDHNHDTGELRGILCNSCNRAIGGLGDTVEGVRKALTYLENPVWRTT